MVCSNKGFASVRFVLSRDKPHHYFAKILSMTCYCGFSFRNSCHFLCVCGRCIETTRRKCMPSRSKPPLPSRIFIVLVLVRCFVFFLCLFVSFSALVESFVFQLRRSKCCRISLVETHTMKSSFSTRQVGCPEYLSNCRSKDRESRFFFSSFLRSGMCYCMSEFPSLFGETSSWEVITLMRKLPTSIILSRANAWLSRKFWFIPVYRQHVNSCVNTAPTKRRTHSFIIVSLCCWHTGFDPSGIKSRCDNYVAEAIPTYLCF